MSTRKRLTGRKSLICFILIYFPVILAQCPSSTNTLLRIGETRYYIIQNIQRRGEFVTIEQARQDCSKHGLKLATVKNLLSLAVVGRPLERMAFRERMKDTWYWLDAKYDIESEKYHWGNDSTDEVKYTMILYRTPIPIGVSAHITYDDVYQKNQDKPQCLTLTLPWLGSADHYPNTTVFFGHQTSFDERDCKSRQKRHAMCEASRTDCPPTESKPYVLDEEKQSYFEEGNWIYGDRKYIVNWKQKTFNESERYCKSLGLQLMNAGELEKFLIPHIKMWSREITASQFWTGMSYNEKTKQYLDSSGNIITDTNTESNFTESEFQPRSSKNNTVYCVALSLAYEFKSQMPCSNNASSGCQWSFIRYAPANCNNYHGTICQHPDYDEREIKWYPNFKTNLSDVLEKTALTTVFGYKGNNFVLRSKYKQTFGVCYCPSGFRMVRSHKDVNLAWSVKPVNSTGKEIYEYDYTESYWMVDNKTFNKDLKSNCKLSYTDNGVRKIKEIKCTEWYFYLCEKLGRRPTLPSRIFVNKAPPMKWEEGPQPRVYPLVSKPDWAIYDILCPCKLQSDYKEWDAVANECVNPWNSCPPNLFDNNHCQRGEHYQFYSIGGVICKSTKQNDKCTFQKIIYATGFEKEKIIVDKKGITHQPDLNHHQRWKVPISLWVPHKYPFPFFTSEIEKPLYKEAFEGNFSNLPSGYPTENFGCPTLIFDVDGDGYYEISMKFADLMDKESSEATRYKRAFNILLNDLYIAREISPNGYLPRRYVLELNVNFKVFQNGKMFELQGHPSKEILGKKLKLEVCYSFCTRLGYKADPNWLMNAVSIVKFSSKPDDPCECKLKDASKEYNTVTSQCMRRWQITETTGVAQCYNFRDEKSESFCGRGKEEPWVFYALFGYVCRGVSDTSSTVEPLCEVEKRIYGANFGGPPHNDSRGVLHDKLNSNDLQGSVWGIGPSQLPAQNVPAKDVLIYKTWGGSNWIEANKTGSDTSGCDVLTFPTSGDGRYEISMKTGEMKKNPYDARAFSIMLNDMYIVREFVVEKYRLHPKGLELVQNFKIFQSNKMLQLQEHPPREIERSDKKLELKFCYSRCDIRKLDRNWVMYGLSIVKFKS